MEVFISIVGSLAGKAAEYTVDPAARQLSYLFKPRSKFLNLRSKVQDLNDARERLQQSVEAATRNGEVIFDDVQRWLTEVNDKISEQAVTLLQDDEEKVTKRCFMDFCPDFKSRYHFSKKADKEANAIAQLLTKRDTFNAVGYLPAVEVMDIIRPVKEYEAFGSRSAAFDGVMVALEDETVSIIGVYGMGGVGKTTLVKEVAGQSKEKLGFDEVIFVTVTQTPNTLNIQNEIANQLGVELDKDQSEHVGAVRLRDRLKKAKKILVILDDLWKEQEVDTFGIPLVDQHKGCKMLMTSRSLDVLKRMDSHHNISIDILKEDEAWNLFKKTAGDIVESSDLRSTAFEIAKRCAGLPIAIVTIAKTLKPKENLCEWEDALRRLSKPSERNFKGIPAKAYSAIELSYKFLEGEELGPIFLLCSIMGHDATVEDLLRFSIGLGFVHDVKTMKESRDSVLTLVNNLKTSCLLLEVSHPTRFDMHDVVRDVAHSIASRDLHWLVLFKEWPDEEKLKESQLICLQNVEVSELNHELNCPNLTYFSVGMKDYSSLNISNNFFKGMQRLKVLEFSQMHLTSLPSSLDSLKSLCTLRLIGCDLEDIVILGGLEKLEILDLRRSRIKMLPKEIGQLAKLKLLDLSGCYNLEVIPPYVLSKLSKLGELYLYRSFDRWEVDGIGNPRSNASLVELQHLSCLTTLEVHIPHVEAIPNDKLFLGKMERYKISIGYEKWGSFDDRGMEALRMLKLNTNKSICLVDGIKLLLSRTQSLYLDGMKDVGEMQMVYHPNAESFGQLRFIKAKNCMLQNLFSFSIAQRLSQLEQLEVSYCENIIGLIVEKEEIDENNILEFNKLSILKLYKLNRFSGLWYLGNTLQSSTCLFDKKVSCPVLEKLELNGCHKLKYVFTSSLIKSFVHLKTLEVSDCDEMDGIIEGTLAREEGISSSIMLFPKLVSMMLRFLPKLRRLCCGINPIKFSSLQFLDIWACPALNTFPFDDGKSSITPPYYFFNERVILPVLEQLKIQDMDNLERLWADQLVEHSFSKLTSISLEYCPKLMHVFPLSMLTRIQRLERLLIWNCPSVEEIVSEGGNNSSGMPPLSPQFIRSDVISFELPNLTSLELIRLPNLKSIHHNKMFNNWPSLKEMTVAGCQAVEILFANSQETSSQQPRFG